ncbi:MAG: GspH/FimT family pseudopilin [Candidatus Thiodiazotropha sp.]|jgi:type IV fimbrial biogenesis protein FimT
MKQIQGFTVVELMITLVIVGILTAAGIPAFLNMIENNTITTTSNGILNGILLARSEAVLNDVDVTFTPSASGWQVTNPTGDVIQSETIDNSNIAIAGPTIVYTPRGRKANNTAQTISISYKNSLKSRVCLSLTGRPFIVLAEDGTCP